MHTIKDFLDSIGGADRVADQTGGQALEAPFHGAYLASDRGDGGLREFAGGEVLLHFRNAPGENSRWHWMLVRNDMESWQWEAQQTFRQGPPTPRPVATLILVSGGG